MCHWHVQLCSMDKKLEDPTKGNYNIRKINYRLNILFLKWLS